MSRQKCDDDLSRKSELSLRDAEAVKTENEGMAIDEVPIDISKQEEIIAKIMTEAESEEIIYHLSLSTTAHFKSQQVNDPELDADQKRQIATKVLAESPAKFLSQFGRHLEEKHLSFFTSKHNVENYELEFHLRELKRFHSKEKKQVDVKNRRFQALKRLQKEGTYFSETVMKERNPLLYEQLIGQYLTQHEIEDRAQEAMRANSTLVGVLMAQIERDQMSKLHQLQKDSEDGAREEVDTSDEDSEQEMATDDDTSSEDGDIPKEKKMKKKKLLSYTEKELLKTEFYSHMYNSFLDGKDNDFDYSQVDFNPDCECLAVRAQDEEEKYFDSETPEEEDAIVKTTNEDEEEDELDVFMNSLQPDPTPSDLCGKIKDQAVL